jgi:hypothetical protein
MPTDINLPVRTPFLMNRLRFVLTLLNGDAVKAEPAKNVSVTVHLLSADGKPAAVLVNGRADAQGRVAFFISDQPPKDPAAQREPLPKIQIIVRDVDGDAIGQSVALQPERGKELPAQKVSVKAHLEKLEAPLDVWTTATGMRLSPKVDQALKSSKIGSLAKLRAAKDIEKTPGLGQADIKELKLLQKHSRLQLISRDHKANQHLVDAGISDVTDIARLTRSSFAKKLKGKLNLQKANALHGAAMRATAIASRLAMADRVDAANNRVAKVQASTAEPQPCECDCQSAVSPLAYLADLLDYAVRHVLFNAAELSMDQLGEQFFQPFATLPADCSASETQVRQVRLCIEVLRKKAAKEGTDISAIVEAHAKSSYPSLLSALGVTHTDLRLARAASDERKQTLADRMGVPVAQLFVDFLLNESAQTEEKLNELFGLPPTKPGEPAAAEPALQKAKLARLDEIWLAADTAAQPVWIDPDFVSTAFFAVTGSTAEQLLAARTTDLAKLYGDIKLAVNTNPANLTEVMKSDQASAVHGMHGLEIGTEAELDEFNIQRQEGRAYTRTVNSEIVSLDFGKLSIRKSELDQLLVVRQLASDNSVTSEDWEEAHHVLSAIEKRSQLLPKWELEERAQNIVLSPAVFSLPGDMLALLTQLQSNPPGFLRWRLDTRALRDWLTVLEDRIAQRDAALASIQAAADAAEEAHLVSLRDALLNAVISKQTDLDAAGVIASESSADKLEKKRKWVTNHLLISAHESACRKTTRVAQAIECLQLLLWGIHSKLLERDDFTLDADDFESEWKGLGTYKAWRALMWVYLYPENIARPSYIKPNNRTYVLDVYDLLMKHWQLLGVDTTADPPDGVSLITWGWAQSVASESKKGSLLGDSDFMTMSSSSLQEVVTKLGELADELRIFTEGPSYAKALLELRYFVPLDIAFRLRDEGRPVESIEWLRRAADLSKAADLSTGRPNDPEAADYLESLRTLVGGVSRDDDWLTSPLPHEAAEHTPGGYERRVLLGAISAYLDMAEADFARDTTESLARAREAYLAALDLLNSPVLGAPSAPCSALTIEIGDEKIKEIVIHILGDLLRGNPLRGFDRDQLHVADKALEQLIKGLRPGSDLVAFRDKVRLTYEKAKPRGAAKTMKSKVGEGADNQARSVKNMLEDQALFDFVQTGFVRNADGDLVKTEWIRPPFFSFCIPPNPVIHLLRLRAESGFFKLTHCMNAAGLKRETPAYSAPTDVTSGVAVELVESAPTASTEYFMPPGAVIYRFRVLIERARQLVSIAQQVESTYLQFLERRDAEQFTVMQARQGLSLASATVSLQDLRVGEADHGRELAHRQGERVDETLGHYQNLIAGDWISYMEGGALISSYAAAAVEGVAALAAIVAGASAGASITAIFSALATAGVGAPAGATAGGVAGGGAGLIASGILGGGRALSSLSGALSMHAGFERRKQEWEFQRDLAEIDQQIAEIQQTLAEDRYQITSQERRISQLSRDHASDVVEFLDSKFTDRELYAWMGGIVGQAYRYFLQQASSMAKLAQRQLAFERQEPELGFILDDYWTHTPSGSLPGSGDERDRRGMTGSVRLLQDITRLDQRAFLTDRRRIPLPKHISLSAHDPVAFMRFRESGVLHIATSLDMFDRDFPGDYLRLVKRIRVAVIALIPPLDGIKATLSSTGISRVVRGGVRFVESTITTQPETVAITAPVSGPGVVELQQEQAEMLLPFEGLGVAGNWVLTMPKAANAFDFNTIADVVFTIEYTAIYSDELRQQVVQRLNADRTSDGERAFSLRHHFADEWYNLHHPELFDDVNRRLRPVLEFTRSDYPPNLIEGSLKISHLTLFVARSEGFNDEIEVSELSWEPQNGTVSTNANTLTTRNGVLTTRDVPASIWLGAPLKESPVAKLSFKLGGTIAGKSIEQALREGLITDILVAVAIRGDQPVWPL